MEVPIQQEQNSLALLIMAGVVLVIELEFVIWKAQWVSSNSQLVVKRSGSGTLPWSMCSDIAKMLGGVVDLVSYDTAGFVRTQIDFNRFFEQMVCCRLCPRFQIECNGPQLHH